MLLQSLLRPVLTPIMRGIFDPSQSVSAAWSPLALWPDGIATPGMWISPRDLTSEWADYTGTTPVVTPGTVADSSNPVGLALDIRAGATVLTDPGNHMLQSTSAARPLMSARRNLLTYTEDFSSSWTVDAAVLSASAVTPPDIATTAVKFTKNAGGGFASVYRYYITTGNYNWSLVAKSAGWQYLGLYLQNPDRFCYFDLVNGVLGTVAAGCVATIEDLGDGWFRCSVSHVANGTNAASFFATPTDNVYAPTGDGVSGIYVTAAQYEIGTQVTSYQAILTGSTYPSTDFPVAQLYDGVDDGMATADFTTGTLTSAMDCMIPVRRDSAAESLLGISGEPSFTEKYTGACINNLGDITYKDCGTPTVWVDGVQLAGGTATTCAALFAALTVGDWHILEYRNLNLSAWTAVHYGNVFTGLNFNGPRGDIMLFPSTASTTDKDAARQWLADYYGVALP